jgi:hypothetical protein
MSIILINTMNTLFTFFILITLLNDIFEFYCQDMFSSSTCKAPLAPVSSSAAATELIFIKAVVLPEWFLKFASFLLCCFTATATVKAVAMTIVLASIATLALLYHIKSKTLLSLEYSKSEDDFIEMIDISAVSHVTVNKKPFSHFSPDNEPFKEKKTLLLPSAPIKAVSYTVNVGDLFPESYYVVPAPARSMSYAEAVGYANVVTKPPRHGHTIESYAYLGDLFPEEATNNTQSPPVRKNDCFLTGGD